MVVDLFEPDEFNAITMDLKTDAYAAGMSDTPVQLREFFYQVINEINTFCGIFSFFILNSVYEIISILSLHFLQLAKNFVKYVVYILLYSIVQVSIGLRNGVKYR